MADKMMRIAGRGEDGLAKAISTDDSGNLGTRISRVSDTTVHEMTLKGKVAGNTLVPHKVTMSGTETLSPPTSPTPKEISQLLYDRLSVMGGDFALASTQNGKGILYMTFNVTAIGGNSISELKSNISYIRPTIVGRGRMYDGSKYLDTLYGADSYIYNYTLSIWEKFASNNSLNFELMSTDINNTTDYISDNGEISLAMMTTHSSAGLTSHISYANLDYVSVDVGLVVYVPFSTALEKIKVGTPSGGLVVKTKDGTSVDLTAVTDLDGHAVLRVVDAAPHGYAEDKDHFKVDSQKANLWLQNLYDEQAKTNALLEVLTGTNALYDADGDRASWILGTSGGAEGASAATKEDGYMHFTAGSPTGSAYQAMETEHLVDLTNIRYLVVDWENSGDNSTLNQSRLQISLQKNGAADWNFEKQLLVTSTFARREDKLDVTNVKGKYYIQVFGRDGSSGSQVNCDLKVYEIRKEV